MEKRHSSGLRPRPHLGPGGVAREVAAILSLPLRDPVKHRVEDQRIGPRPRRSCAPLPATPMSFIRRLPLSRMALCYSNMSASPA